MKISKRNVSKVQKMMIAVALPVIVLCIGSAFAATSPIKSSASTDKTNAILLSIEKQLVNLNDQIADMNRQMHTLTQIEANR